MKIATFGDLHAHKFQEFAKVDDVTGNSRLTDIIGCLSFMRQYCIENKIEVVLDAGDIFHKRGAVDTEVFNYVFREIKAFSDAGIQVVMIPGNHTQYSNEDLPQHSIEPFKEIPLVTVLDTFDGSFTVKDSSGDEVNVYPVPYSKNADMIKKAIDKYASDTTNNGLEHNAILLGHLGVSGAFVGKSNYAMADAFAVEDLSPHAFKFVVLGHFHKYQDLGGYNHVFYTGAPLQHNFNDSGQDKGFWVIDTNEGTKEIVHIPTKKFMTVKVDAEIDIDKLEEDLKDCYVRFQVTADAADDVSTKMEQLENADYRMEINKEYVEEKRINVDVSMSISEAVLEYAKEFMPEAKEVGLEILRDVM